MASSLILSKDNFDDYHLSFVNDNHEEDFRHDVNVFLRRMFAPERAPLIYASHRAAQTDGVATVLVKFRLSTTEIQADGRAFEEAGKSLCSRIFQRDLRRHLIGVTTKSILGVSAVSRTWKTWFNRAFFLTGINEGRPFVQDVARTFNDDWLPSWALVFVFTIAAGINISIFAGGTASQSNIAELMSATCGSLAGEVLSRYTESRSTRPHRDIILERVRKTEIFLGNVDAFVRASERFTNEYRSPHSLLPSSEPSTGFNNQNVVPTEFEICEALYDFEESAAQLVTINNESLVAFFDIRNRARHKLASNTAGFGLSLGAIASAVSVTTSTTTVAATAVAPEVLAASGLAGFTGNVVLTSSALACNPWIAIPATAMALKCVVDGRKQWKQNRKAGQMIKLQTAINTIVNRAWNLAYDSRVFLEYVHFITAVDNEEIPINDNTLETWTAFIMRVREVLGPQVTEQMLGPYTLATFMDYRREELQSMVVEMNGFEQNMYTVAASR